MFILKRWMAIVLTMVLLLSCSPMMAFADGGSEEILIYEQNFNASGMPDGWTGMVHNNQMEPWSVTDGKLVAQWVPDETNSPANSNCSYLTEQTMLWSDYGAEADITLYKQANGSFPSVALCTYVFPGGSKRIEIRVGIVNESTYSVGLYIRSETNSFAVPMANFAPGGKIAGYDAENGKVSFHLKADMSGKEVNVYIDGAKVWGKGYSLANEKLVTGGGIGFFAMRSGSNAGNVKLEIDNVKVTRRLSQGELIEVDFTDPDHWDIAKSASPQFQNGGIRLSIDASKNANAAAALVLPEAQQWQNYRFGAEITVEKTATGNYAYASLRAYSSGTSYASQNKSTYEFRVGPRKDGFVACLYKMHSNAAGSRVATEMIRVDGLKIGSNSFGNDTITYHAAIQIQDGVIGCFINGELVLTYDTAEEEADWGAAHEKGAVGLFIARASSNDKDTVATFRNLSLEKASKLPEANDGLTDRAPSVVNGNGYLAVGLDAFENYAEGEMGRWTSKHADSSEGQWSIRNGMLLNSADDPENSSIILKEETIHSFGGVAADVMLTSKISGNDQYVGLVGAYNNLRNFYHLRFMDAKSGEDKLQLYRYDRGSANLLESVTLDFAIERNTWYQMEMYMVDGVIYGAVNGKVYISYSTENDPVVYTTGLAGFRTTKGSAAFDNFAVLLQREDPAIDENFNGLTGLNGTHWTEDKTNKKGGTWSVSGGSLLQSNEGANGDYIQLYDDGRTVGLGGAAADVKITSKNVGDVFAGLVAGYNSGDNYYCLRLADKKEGGDLLQLLLSTSGKEKVLSSVTLPFSLQRNQWYNLELYCYENVIHGYVDGKLLLAYSSGGGLLLEEGVAGIAIAQGSCAVDNFKVYGAAKSHGSGVVYNDTVVQDPDVFKDDFSSQTVGKTPDYWLQDNEEKTWFVASVQGNKVYGVNNTKTVSHTWLHVFETNVDYSAKLYVPSNGVTAASKVGLTIRHTGILTEAWVQIGYDFAKSSWYVRDVKGVDFVVRMIYAPQSTAFSLDSWNTVRVYAVGEDLQVYCNNVLVLETKVGQVTTGRVGFFTEKTELYADDVQLKLLSGQGRVEKAALENYVLNRNSYTEGGSIFVYSENVWIYNYDSELYISEDQGTSFRKATAAERAKYAFFAQSTRTQYIRLHNGYILKVDNYTGGKAYLSKDNGATYEQVGAMWKEEDLPQANFAYYGGMNDMIKEVQLADGSYRVFYCADARSYGNPEGTGSIDYHWEEVYYTDDFGYTWHKSKIDTRAISALPHICESRIVSCSDGTLRMYCTWNKNHGTTLTAEQPDSMRYFISYDNGVTWEGEYAIPQTANPCSSFGIVKDTDGTYYMICVFAEQAASVGTGTPRTRLSLFRSKDGINWDYLMDCWRWEEVPGDRAENINQIVDPSLTVTDDYIMVTSGWGEVKSSGHNEQRQHILKIDKSELKPYEQWPNYEEYTDPKDILYIKAVDVPKFQKQGEALNLEGAYLILHHLDGSTSKVPMSDAGIVIEEVVENYNQWTNDMPAPDMTVLGKKMLRITYRLFACNTTIQVVEELPDPGTQPEPDPDHVHVLTHTEAVSAGCTLGGMKEYWYCRSCDTYFDSADAKNAVTYVSLAVPAHEPKRVEETWIGCRQGGMQAHWYCEACDAYYADETFAQTVTAESLQIPGHTLQHVEAVAATETESGVKEHWLCSQCGIYYAEPEGKTPVAYTDLILSPNEAPQPEEKTFPVALIFGIVAVAAAAVAAVFVIKKRR